MRIDDLGMSEIVDFRKFGELLLIVCLKRILWDISALFEELLFESMLGFFIGPHLPKSIWRIFSKSPLENPVTVNFKAHNNLDAVYFAEKAGLKISQ